MRDAPSPRHASLVPINGTVATNAGRRDEAATVLRQALAEYESKPIIRLAQRVRERIAAVEDTHA